MSWQDDLLKKGVSKNGVRIGSNNRGSDSTRSTVFDEGRKDIVINKVKGETKMITVEAALSDLEKIEKDETLKPEAKILRAMKLIVKFLSTMRSNQLLTDEDKKTIKIKIAQTKKETSK